MRMTLWTLLNFPSLPPPLPSVSLLAVVNSHFKSNMMYYLGLSRGGNPWAPVLNPFKTPWRFLGHTRPYSNTACTSPPPLRFNGKLTILSRIWVLPVILLEHAGVQQRFTSQVKENLVGLSYSKRTCNCITVKVLLKANLKRNTILLSSKKKLKNAARFLTFFALQCLRIVT